MIIRSKTQADSIIRGVAINATGRDDALVSVKIDNGIISYQGPAREIADRVTSAGMEAIKGRYISVSLVNP